MIWRFLSILFLGLAAASLTGCFKDPGYSSTPQISLNRVRFVQGGLDTIILAIDFKDAEGDIGLDNSADSDPRFAKYLDADSLEYNPWSRNIWVSLMVENAAGGYDSFPPGLDTNRNGETIVDERYFDGRTPIFTRLERETDVQGTLTYKILNQFYAQRERPFIAGRHFFLKVRLIDRQLHVSNELITPAILIPPEV